MNKTCGKCGNDATEDALFCPRCGNSLKAVGADPLVGTVVADRYLLVEKIGEGRSGMIYRGEHTALRKKVAVKILHQQLSEDETAMERFRREATTVGEMDNDHILQVLDFGRAADGRLFFAMELLDGEPLSKLLERSPALSIPKVVDILTQAGEALMEAHGLGYVHRDLRPRNIFLSKKRGKTDFVKLLDFGLSKLLVSETEAGSTVMGITFGDPRYISPEQARGDTVDRRSDIYALGAVAFEMLAGEAAFAGARASDIIEKHLKGPVPSVRAKRGDVPVWLDKVIEKMLAKVPDQRFITVLRMIECLKAEKAPGDEKSLELDSTEPFQKSAVDTDSARTIVPGEGPTAPAVAAAAQAAPAKEPEKEKDPAPSETARLPNKVALAAMAPVVTPAPVKTNGTGSHSAIPAKEVSDSGSRKSKKQQKAEKKAEEAKKREQGKSGERKAIDNWWPPERKEADKPAAAPGKATPSAEIPAVPAVVVSPSATEPSTPIAARAAAETANTEPAIAMKSGLPLPGVDDAVTDKRPLARSGTTGSHPKVGSQSGSHRRVTGEHRKVGAQTGEHDTWFDDGSQGSAALPHDDFDEHPPKRNVGLIAGLAVGGVVAVGLILPAVLGRSTEKTPEGPKRSYDTPAVSAALEGKVPATPPKTEAAKPPEPVKPPEPTPPPVAVAPTPAPPPVAVAPTPAPKVEEPPKPAPPPKVEEPVVEKKPEKAPEPKKEKVVEAPKPAPEPKKEKEKVAAVTAPKSSPKNMPEGFRDPFSDKAGLASQSEAFIKFGRQKLNSGDVAGAAAQFNKAREYDNKNSEAIAGLGECAFEQGDYGGATVFLKQAVKLAPRRVHYEVLLGQAYYKLGRTKDAVTEYKRALKLDPKNEEAAHSLEVAERKLGGG